MYSPGHEGVILESVSIDRLKEATLAIVYAALTSICRVKSALALPEATWRARLHSPLAAGQRDFGTVSLVLEISHLPSPF